MVSGRARHLRLPIHSSTHSKLTLRPVGRLRVRGVQKSRGIHQTLVPVIPSASPVSSQRERIVPSAARFPRRLLPRNLKIGEDRMGRREGGLGAGFLGNPGFQPPHTIWERVEVEGWSQPPLPNRQVLCPPSPMGNGTVWEFAMLVRPRDRWHPRLQRKPVRGANQVSAQAKRSRRPTSVSPRVTSAF
jgi:hypothetical protein